MKIRRFVADDFQEALRQAKAEMGQDAVIIHSRKFKQGGIFGLFARTKVELTVAADSEMRPVEGGGVSLGAARRRLESVSEAHVTAESAVSPAPVAAPAPAVVPAPS
ncbi:MAG: hypothetical protein QHH05_05450, partial [Syntrophomonadaceae bacterium]|nr:hypothetical protein [Syntrophomonadaceae bacterium]